MGRVGHYGPCRTGQSDESVEIYRTFDRVREAVQAALEFYRLSRLDQTEMAFRQDEVCIAHQGAEDGQADLIHAILYKLQMALASHLV